MGGLGNQMFQYAAGRTLSIKLNVPLKLDLSFLEDKASAQKYGYTGRDYELSVFNISSSIATPEDLQKMKGFILFKFPIIEKVFRKTAAILKYNGSFYYKQPHFGYDTSFLQKKAPLFLEGYWQSEKYFEPIANQIRADFTLKQEFDGKNKEVQKLMQSTNSISLHIRRGDYVSNVHAQKVHGLCDINYYEEAMKILETKEHGNINYFVFSDDLAWAKENLSSKYPLHFIDNNAGKDSYKDILLMSYCQHNIIANSSFSWWGAWLNPNPDKMVIAPKKWFGSYQVNLDDMFPLKWQLI